MLTILRYFIILFKKYMPPIHADFPPWFDKNTHEKAPVSVMKMNRF